METVKRTKKGMEPPYILVYRNGVLDTPSTLVANITARTAGAILAVFAFMLLGIIMLGIGILIGSIFVYTTSRALKNHASMEKPGETHTRPARDAQQGPGDSRLNNITINGRPLSTGLR